MRPGRQSLLLVALAGSLTAAPLLAQSHPLSVGTVAPDFTLPAATREGISKTPLHLADLKGQTVVLAFFYKARTKG